MAIVIATDSTGNILPSEAKELGVKVIPLNIVFEEGTYKEDVEISSKEFYKRLVSEKTLPKTSQPSPSEFLNLFEEVKKNNDELILITLASDLSGTYQFAQAVKEDVGYEKIHIIDSKTTMMGMRILVEEALRLKKEGVNAKEIVDHIEKMKTKIRTAGIVDTLEYLYKGGRLSKTAAVLGNVLGIKPVLKLENGVISMVDKARGTGNAIKLLMQYLDKNPIDFDKKVYFGYTGDPKRLDKLTKEFCHKYKNYSLNKKEYKIISGVIGTHLGPGVCMIIYLTK